MVQNAGSVLKNRQVEGREMLEMVAIWAQRKISGDKLFLLLLHHGTV